MLHFVICSFILSFPAVSDSIERCCFRYHARLAVVKMIPGALKEPHNASSWLSYESVSVNSDVSLPLQSKAKKKAQTYWKKTEAQGRERERREGVNTILSLKANKNSFKGKERDGQKVTGNSKRLCVCVIDSAESGLLSCTDHRKCLDLRSQNCIFYSTLRVFAPQFYTKFYGFIVHLSVEYASNSHINIH